VQFAILGEIRAVTEDNQPVPLGAPQQRAALAILLLAPRRVVPVSRLIEAIWDDPPPSAVKSLHGYVHRLRGILRGQPRVALRTAGAGYLLDIDPERVDLHRYRRLVAEADGADDEMKVTLLTEADELWRGPPISGGGSSVLRNIAAQIEEERLAALDARLVARLRLRQHADCIAELNGLVAAYPLRERTRAMLMLALFRCGRRADALAVFSAGRKLMAEELGVDPGAELTSLHEQILRDDVRLRQVPPDDNLAGDDRRGEAGRAAPGERGPAAAESGHAPAELPHDIGGFVARGSELAELNALLAANEATTHGGSLIAAVDGIGGVGKTALVVHWAHQVRSRFPAGQIFLDLRGHDPHLPPLAPEDALAQLLRACGVPAAEVPEGRQQRSRAYRSAVADGRWLIVLDNAASADQVRPLLPGGRDCVTVVTSRSFLAGLIATEGAHRIEVNPLPAHDAVALLGVMTGRVAAEPDAAAELASLCGHLPLALRIAGASLVAHADGAIASFAARLARDPIGALSLEQDAAVRSTFDVSYRDLTGPAQRMLTLLGAFPGPDFTGPLAAALAGEPEEVACRVLAELRTGHFVEYQLTGRLRMHDIVRQYAAGLAAHGDPEAVRDARRRAVDWYLDNVRHAVSRAGFPKFLVPQADAAIPEMPDRFADESAAVGWLEDERPNLVALVCSVAAADTYPATLRIAIELRGFFRLRRYVADWLEVTSAAVDLARRSGSSQDEAASLHSLGHAHWSVGEYAATVECYEASLAASRAGNWAEGIAAAQSALGSTYHDMGRHADAVTYFEQALAVGGDAVPALLRMITVGSLGLTYQSTGRLHRSIECFAAAGQIAGQLGLDDAVATSVGNIGMTHIALGELTLARDELDRALTSYRKVGSRNGEANVLTSLANLNVESGRYDDAAYQSALALRIARDIRDRRIECDALIAGGMTLSRRGDLMAAGRRLTEAAEIGESIGYQPGIGLALAEAAQVELQLGNARSAAAMCERSASVTRQCGARTAEVLAVTVWADACLALSQYDAASVHIEAALRNCREMGLRLLEARVLRARGAIHAATRGADAASSDLMEAAVLEFEMFGKGA
jgi:DNA-binding SARP family transcriptional activator/tetratricopeptide (TPR) repeat protein